MKHNMQLARKQLGFTLVEIAIVLVIIGLLLGGVLKGQEMIENSRIKAVVNDMNGFTAAYNSYFDRYRQVPGDESSATMIARGWGTGNVGSTGTSLGNGRLDIPLANTFTNGTGANEQGPMWRALRGAGLIGGNPDSAATVAGLPRASTGGLIGVTTNAWGLTGPVVCVSGLTAKQAAGVDVAVDGPVTGAATGNSVGSVRAEARPAATPQPTTATAPAPVAYDESVAGTWTVCRGL